VKKRYTDHYILSKIEFWANKLFDEQGWQWGDYLNNQFGWLRTHRQDAREPYVDGSRPIFNYRSAVDKKRLKRRLLMELKTWESSKIEPRTVEAVMKIIEEEYE
jgi:hypothetical protein